MRTSTWLLAAGFAAHAAWAAPDPAAATGVVAVLVTIENDKFFAGSDRHYTQGLRVQVSARRGLDGEIEKKIAALLQKLPWQPALTDAKASFAFGQDMFTPEDTETSALLRHDRPYAAWLYLATGYHAIIEGRRSLTAELSYGVVGPHALGAWAQNRWHDVIKVPHAQGWANQLHHEIGLNAAAEWRYRYRRTWFDFIPRVGLALGNIRTHLALGAALRIGLRLPDDFGSDLIRPATTAGVAAPVAFGAHVFVSAEARAVGRDIFLDGNTFRASHSVPKRPVVADLNAGFSLRGPWKVLPSRGWVLTYTQNYRTKEFYGQPRQDVFGSVSLGLLF